MKSPFITLTAMSNLYAITLNINNICTYQVDHREGRECTFIQMNRGHFFAKEKFEHVATLVSEYYNA